MDAALLDWCRRLIGCRSVTAEGTRQIAALCASEMLAPAGITARLIPSTREGGQQINLVAAIRGRDSSLRPIVLNTHLDTVPPGAPDLWTACDGDPFSARVDGDHIYGLGAADTKLDLAAKIFALNAVGRPRRDVYLVGTFGEEHGLTGAKEMAEAAILPPGAMAFVGEPSRLEVITAHKGLMMFELALGFTPLRLQAKEGLSLVNGTQAMLSVGLLALREAELLADTADISGALSLDALRGSIRALDPRLHDARPHPGQMVSARRIAQMLRGSAINKSHQGCARVQDAYSLRCMPQVHGAVRDALAYVRRVCETEMNSATDNPLVFVSEREVISGGNFHGQPLALALDLAAIALAQLGGIAERRIDRLVNPLTSELPAFLTRSAGLESGLMLAQVTAAALASENKVLAHPASVDSIPTSGNKEDFVSMGMGAALKLQSVVTNVQTILAIELLAACQALDLLLPLRSGRLAERARAEVRRVSPPVTSDRPLHTDIARISDLVRDGSVAGILPASFGLSS
jgi:histidine ammonia-lyase